MLDITHAMELAGFLKTAGEMTKAMIGIRDSAALQGKVIELNGIILSAQGSALASNQDQFALLSRVGQLEKEVAQFKNWETEKERYILTDYGSGTYAYALKPAMANGEPPHRICPNCYEDGKRGLLQYQGKTHFSQDHFVCTRCKVDYFFGASHTPDLDSHYRRSRDDPF